MLLAFVLSASAASWPPGEVINPGVSVDITADGFDAVAALIPNLLPSSIEIPETSDGYGGVLDQCWLGGYEYALRNGSAAITVTDTAIVPGEGVLDITANLEVAVNSEADPFELYTSLECIDDTCYGYVNPFPVEVHTTMRLAIVDDGAGHRSLDATMGEIEVAYELDGASDIYLAECTVGSIEEVLNYVGLSIYDLLIGALDSTLQDQIASMGPELEAAIEDAFAAATIEQDLELNGALVHLLLQPSNVDITPASLRLWMEGSFEGEPAACIAAYDPGGSLRTDSQLPGPTQVPSGVDADYHAGILVGDDFANSALYALWRGGLLCYELDSASSPIALDTTILNALTGDVFAPLFPESKPVELTVRPTRPPEVAYTGEHDLGLTITDLDLDFYAELDGRAARVISVELDGQAGADLALDGTTGSLAIEVDLDPNDFTPSVSYNEVDEAANEHVVSSFGGLFQTVLDTVAGSLLDSLAFSLPSFSGLGLTELVVSEAGADKDWLGVYAWLGPVDYGSGSSCGGCGGDTGTVDTGGGSSCGGGCSTLPTAPWAAVGFATLWLRRRRG